jgi:Tol biopolymer transport system component
VLDGLDGDAPIRRLTTEVSNIRPVWIDDGRLAFGSDRDGAVGIYIQKADGSDVPVRLTTAPEGSGHRPESWSQRHGELSFSVFRDDATDTQRGR